MKVDINKMKDYFQVLQFVGRRSAALQNVRPAAHPGYMEANDMPLIEGGVSISFVAGTIRGGEQERMNSMIFRISRTRC